MGQITTGIRSILNLPRVYIFMQGLLRGHFLNKDKWRTDFVENFVRPRTGDKVLDIGCGPAGIFKHLSNIDYWGFDISGAYIKYAKIKYGNMGHFFCKELTAEDLEYLPRFDIVLAIGVIHHMSDATVWILLDLVHRALKPGGRLITVDPCFEAGQNPLAWLLISWDRGQNVRSREGYTALVSKVFPEHHIEIRHRSWIPYTHCFMECTRT